MPHVHAIRAARAVHGPVMHRKDHRIALTQRHDFRARLHAWTLLRQYELTAREILAWFGQQDRELQRKNVLAIQVLMQAVVIASRVALTDKFRKMDIM